MKLATLKSDQADGRLVIVSRDGTRAAPADFPNLQAALDNWSEALPLLQARSDGLTSGRARGAFPFEPNAAAAPLPRCYQWLDGSAFQSHGDLMAKVFKIDNPQTDRPLMYQGMSHEFLGGTEDVVLPSEGDG